ncbi:MAG: GNAT family N-acetyltransferase [Prevotellaceae bacterium]|nr:GNAT family N-acetyltransferase [Candidatus Minthosoma equi]
MQIIRYSAERRTEWDNFVEGSKNGTFLFLRGYMDYHSDRFADHSLMFYSEKGMLLSVLPANEKGDERGLCLYSHQGLTYGGFVLGETTGSAFVMELFDCTISYLRELGFKLWYYKQMPSVYHRCPAEEDEYALWRHNAIMDSCLISTAIPLNGAKLFPEVERRRLRGARRAKEAGLRIVEDGDLAEFWPIMEDNLMSRYSVVPVHTLDEMRLLQSRFPDKIKCFMVEGVEEVEGVDGVESVEGVDGVEEVDGVDGFEKRWLAGCIVYIANDACVHIQYGHATPEGKKAGALDLLYLHLIDKYKDDGYCYLDFGNSNEQGGWYLNENLIAQKEGFGGRGIAYKRYELSI